MEEKYYLYKGKLFSYGTIKEKYGDSTDTKISELGMEDAYEYNGKVFGSSTLKEKYGDDYKNAISEKGITEYGVKKKGQTQPQKEDSTNVSQTVAEPLQESGKSPYDIRTSSVQLPNETAPSTVRMAAETFDGKNWHSFPTLFPKDPNNQTNNLEDWIDLSDNPKAAFEEAKKRGEVWDFDSSDEALKFAEGSWKKESGGETNYLVNETAVTKDDLKENLYNEEFIQKVRSGEFNIEVKNDPQLQQELEQIFQPPKYNKEFKEQDFFDGEFGAALKALDIATPFGIGEFIDDMGRAISGGQKQGATVDDALYLMVSGGDASEKKIQDYIDAVEVTQSQQTSDAMYNFQKELEEKAAKNESGEPDFFDVFSSLNMGVVPEIIVSSLSAMANPSSLSAGGIVVGGAAAGGAIAGGGVGAILAAIASTPYAMATAGTTLETAVTFSDLIQEELAKEQKEFNKDNVKTLLEDTKKLNSMRSKAAGRGITIGVIDALTGKLGGSVGAKITSKTFRASKPLGVATASAIEAVGGSGGEAAGQLVAGQKFSPQEIVLEGIGEVGQAPINVTAALAKGNTQEKVQSVKDINEKVKKAAKVTGKPLYEMNGEPVSKEELNEIIESANVDDLEGMNVVVENDNEMTSKVESVMQLGVTKKKVMQANPNLDEDNVNKITELQVELDNLKENDTEVANDRKKQLKESINEIINPQERTTVEQYGDKKKVDSKRTEEDVDRDRKKELSILDAKQAESEKTGEIPTDENGNAIRIKEEKQKINSKYDAELAELAALESNQEVAGDKVADTTSGEVGSNSEIELKNEGKAEAPTKENVTERLNINNPFYKKVEDALVKLGLIEKYNPETGTGDVVGGFVQQTSDGGFSVRKMLFSQDGSISYFDGDVKVSFDKNGNVISENTKEAKQKAISLEIEGKKESIANLEKIRDSEAFKYKEVTETDVLGNKKKVKKLKTPQELKESTDKINAAINKSKAELKAVEELLTPTTSKQEQEGKDKADALKQESKQQESEGKEDSIISKGVTVEGAPEGIYIDVEMIAGKDGRKLTPEEVLDAIPIDGIEFDNDGNNLMIKLPRELTSSEMMSLMKATEQEAIGQLSNGTGKLYAQSKKLLEDYGNEFNEKFFKTPRKEKLKKYEKSTAGNRIFNKPLEAVKEIANNYYERVFGKKRPIFKGITKIDKELAKRIANAYEAMQNNPNDPEVRAAYKALARETMEQHKEFDKAGFIIEINNKEPYNNSQEMIDDLRENRRIKIFSTESGFGDTPITDKQRKENPLLRDSGKKDANGKPLLINDIFRAIHDFYGHAELGNGFGAIGEENAWNVHARMYSPLARRAMTTETRGQNSWVNFSGINDEAFKKIDRARELRRQGKKAEAQEIVSQIYEMMSFAEQKVGLLPREFSELSLEEGTATAEQKSKKEQEEAVKKAKEAFNLKPDNNKKSFIEKSKKLWDNIFTRLLDRQNIIKGILKGGGLINTYNRLVTSKGASGKAKAFFQEIEKKIYGGLSYEENKKLDEIIFLRRISAIDKNREKRGLPLDVKHPNGLTGAEADIALEQIKKENPEQFKKINDRADKYFNEFRSQLKKSLDAGLITQEMYDNLVEVDYQPRQFLKFLIGDDGVDNRALIKMANDYGLSKPVIKALKDGDNTALNTDSKHILSSAINSAEKRLFQNEVGKTLARELPKSAERLKELQSKKNPTKKEIQELEDLKKVAESFKENPIVGYDKNGKPKYKYNSENSPKGYSTIHYYVDGVQNRILVKDNVYDQWVDNKRLFQNENVRKRISIISGSALLKAMATGINPLFVVTNIPRDFGHILMHTNAFSSILPLGGYQLVKGTAKAWKEMRKGMNSDLFRDFIQYGGMMDFLHTQGGINEGNVLNDLISLRKHPELKRTLSNIANGLTVANKYSEIGFRLALFDKVINDGMKKINSEKLSKEEKSQAIEDLKYEAAARAREIIDFNQGGSWIKDAEAFLPYINAAVQGTRVAVEYAKENPAEYASKVTQAAITFSAITAGTSMLLIAALRGDDDDRKAGDIWVDTMERVSEYEKRTNVIIPTGIKDDKGNYTYIRISKTQQARPIFVVGDFFVENMARELSGKKPLSYDLLTDRLTESIFNDYLPIDPSAPHSLMTRNPLMGGLIETWTGYSFFRDEKISYDIDKVPLSMEGYKSKDMPEFYNELSDKFGLSPARTKNLTEKFLTSPATNPYTAIIYSAADATISDLKIIPSVKKSASKTVEMVVKKFYKSSSDYNLNADKEKEKAKVIEGIEIEEVKRNIKIKEIALGMKNQRTLSKDAKDFVDSQPSQDKEKVIKKILNYANKPKATHSKLDIVYARNNKIKAALFMIEYGDLDKEQLREALKEMNSYGMPISDSFIYEYRQLQKNK